MRGQPGSRPNLSANSARLVAGRTISSSGCPTNSTRAPNRARRSADHGKGVAAASPGLNHPITGVTPVLNNVWYHGAVTYDGTTLQLYLNGVLDGSLTVNRPTRSDSIEHAALGTALTSTGAAAGFFAGTLDEARIWNYARSGQQISHGLTLEIGSSTPGLLGRWGLNEGSGTTAGDSTGRSSVRQANWRASGCCFCWSSASRPMKSPFFQRSVCAMPASSGE